MPEPNICDNIKIGNLLSDKALVPGQALEAKWSFDEKGQLKIVANADFVANRRGEEFEATRTTKDKRDSRPWSFNLQSVVDENSEKGKAYKDPATNYEQPQIANAAQVPVHSDLTSKLPGTYFNTRDDGSIWCHLSLRSDGTYAYYWFNLSNERNEHAGTWKYNSSTRQVEIYTTKQGGGHNYYVLGDSSPYTLSGSQYGSDPLKKK